MPKSLSTLHIHAPIVGAALFAATLGHPADANAFTGDPLFSEINQYSTTIDDDPTDIYFPVVADPSVSLPVALMFQGALVDKADYSTYASIVASYGFAVVVPNNERTVVTPAGSLTGLLAEQGQVQQVLDFVALENQTPTSPLNNLLDPDALGLLGHSFGGAVGLASVQGICIFPFCTDSYSIPAALKAGIFYGTSFDLDPGPGASIPPVNNVVPAGYILGTLDGVAAPANTVETFQQTLNPPNVLVEVDGANHYGITNEDSFRDPVRPTLDQAIATETIGRWSGLFLRAHVLDDSEAFDYVYNFGDALDPVVTTQSVEAVKTPEPSAAVGGLLVVATLVGRRLLKRRGGE